MILLCSFCVIGNLLLHKIKLSFLLTIYYNYNEFLANGQKHPCNLFLLVRRKWNMRKIGGMFHYEPNTPIENGYLF